MQKIEERSLDWSSLVLPIHPSREEIANAVYFHGYQDGWQDLRASLHGTSMQYRFKALELRLKECDYNLIARIQVSNYVLALKRGGMWQ